MPSGSFGGGANAFGVGALGASGASAFTGAGAGAATLGGMGAAFALGADSAASPYVGSLTAAGLTPTGFYYSQPAPGGISAAAYDHYAQAMGDPSASLQLLGLAADTYNVSTSATDREREAHSLATASA